MKSYHPQVTWKEEEEEEEYEMEEANEINK